MFGRRNCHHVKETFRLRWTGKYRFDFAPMLNAGLVRMLPPSDKGGIIVFPTDADGIGGNHTWDFAEWCVSFFDKPPRRVAKVQRVLKKAGLIAAFSSEFTLGNHFRGRYRSRAGSVYNERSLTLEILFLNKSELIEVATELVKEFHLDSVLVKDNATCRVYFVDGKMGHV